MATPRRGRVRSTSWCHLPGNLLRLQFLVAAAPLSVKWQTKLHERRRFATAQLLHRRDQGSCVSVLAPYHSHPPSVLLPPSLRLLLIKQVSCLPHPLPARMQQQGASRRQKCQCCHSICPHDVSFPGYPFALYDFSHAHP